MKITYNREMFLTLFYNEGLNLRFRLDQIEPIYFGIIPVGFRTKESLPYVYVFKEFCLDYFIKGSFKFEQAFISQKELELALNDCSYNLYKINNKVWLARRRTMSQILSTLKDKFKVEFMEDGDVIVFKFRSTICKCTVNEEVSTVTLLVSMFSETYGFENTYRYIIPKEGLKSDKYMSSMASNVFKDLLMFEEIAKGV